MADMQQLESAFLKAHKAGDTKAAGVLAAEIKRQRASKGSSTPNPEDAPVSGLYDQFSAGLESNTELPGQTVEALGKTAQNEDVQGAGKWLRDLTSQPDNFVSASDRFINPKPGDSYVDPILGFGWGNAPGAAAEVGGQLAGDLTVRGGSSAALGGLGAAGGFAVGGPAGAAAGFTGGAATGAFAGPALLEFMRVAGPVAIERAKNNGRDVPTWEDWQVAAAAGGVSGILNSIGIKGIGKLNTGLPDIGTKTITQVVGTGAKESGKKAITEGVTETGQSVAQQTGETLGTDKGLEIDLKQAVGEGILGAGAGGVIDASRNAWPSAALDIRSVNSDIRNNPDARTRAEITRDVNNISDRMKGSNKDPLSSEISGYASDTRRQIAEAIDGQNLSPADIKALKGGMTDARGLTEARLNEIAGRSESPNEIKALARKVQVIREMTMQKPTAKGFRGWAALGASTLGGGAGMALDAYLSGGMGTLGALAGVIGGNSVGKDIARKLRGSQTQGNAIDSLVGAKQARRAKMLLDRYGPSEATKALHTLTEQATARTEQENAQTEAITETNRILKETKDFQKARAKMQDGIQKETDAAAKKEKQAAKDKFDSANRDNRLKAAALMAAQRQVKTDLLAQKLDHQKNIDALVVEMTKTRAELQQKEAVAKANKLDRNADFEIANLRGKMDMMGLEIEKRQLALKKQGIITKNAEKRAARTPEDIKPTVSIMAKAAKKRLDKLSTEQLQDPQLDQFGVGIKDRAHYEEQKARIIALENEGLQAAERLDDQKHGTLIIGAIRDFQSYRGRKNQAKRLKVYHDIANSIPESDEAAHRLITSYIRPLALAFEADGPGAEDSGGLNTGAEDSGGLNTGNDWSDLRSDEASKNRRQAYDEANFDRYLKRNPNAEMDIPF